jgi:hypothetical protein
MSNLLTPISDVRSVAEYLNQHHYLGAARRGFAWSDEFGVMVLAKPTSRKLPHETWLELSRWCLTGESNAGSRQWSRVHKWLLAERPEITTVVSYSDPSVGHTGSLYRACNWIWAPTWMRLRPPPSAGGSWDGKKYKLSKTDGSSHYAKTKHELRFSQYRMLQYARSSRTPNTENHDGKAIDGPSREPIHYHHGCRVSSLSCACQQRPPSGVVVVFPDHAAPACIIDTPAHAGRLTGANGETRTPS